MHMHESINLIHVLEQPINERAQQDWIIYPEMILALKYIMAHPIVAEKMY